MPPDDDYRPDPEAEAAVVGVLVVLLLAIAGFVIYMTVTGEISWLI